MKILILDEDAGFRDQLLDHWSLRDTNLLHSNGGKEAISLISQGELGAVFLSTQLLTIDSLDTLTLIKEKNQGVEVFVLSNREDTSLAESTVRKGAHSTLIRPVSLSLMESLVKKTMARSLNRKNHRRLEEHMMRDLLGSTQAMEKILSTIMKVAPTNSGILIDGETGTGKEFIANLIHRLSNRVDEPFITVNCAAIPENLMESELFGSKKGSFTGAVSDRKGLFEEADTGTLFLDEIGELSLALQVKLLRFIQQKEVRRVGGTNTRIVDVRIIAATNLDLVKAVADGKFREDLYYRLNIFHLRLPPLRERKDNLLNLVQFFVERYTIQNDKQIKGISSDVKRLLMNYRYPGNIRELENIIEHAVVLCEGDYIAMEHLPESILEDKTASPLLSLPVSTDENGEEIYPIITLAEMEKRHIIQSLKALNNNQTEVAKKLGISRSTLWRKLKEHNIEI